MDTIAHTLQLNAAESILHTIYVDMLMLKDYVFYIHVYTCSVHYTALILLYKNPYVKTIKKSICQNYKAYLLSH